MFWNLFNCQLLVSQLRSNFLISKYYNIQFCKHISVSNNAYWYLVLLFHSMSGSKLWFVNNSGQTFTLSSAKEKSTPLLDYSSDDSITMVKRVVASNWCAWGLGHDHRAYVYVSHSDVPIRVSETTFENQVLKQFFYCKIWQCFFQISSRVLLKIRLPDILMTFWFQMD